MVQEKEKRRSKEELEQEQERERARQEQHCPADGPSWPRFALAYRLRDSVEERRRDLLIKWWKNFFFSFSDPAALEALRAVLTMGLRGEVSGVDAGVCSMPSTPM